MAVVPEPPTIRDGITPSSTWNQFRDAIRFLQNPPLVQLRQTSAQSIANATLVAIQLNAEDVDSDIDGTGGHDNVTNNTRFTARFPGWYWLGGGIGYATNATGYRSADFAVNGVFVNGSSALAASSGGGNSTRVAARGFPVYLGTGDFVEIYAFQTSGAPLNTAVGNVEQPTMAAHWVSR